MNIGMSAMPKIMRIYFRPEPRCSQKAQDETFASFTGRVVAYTDLDMWFKHHRKGEVAGVTFFHRLATNTEELMAVRERIKAAGLIVLEGATGRRTDNPDEAVEMYHDARDFYARKGLTTAEARAMGAAGGKMSPVTKSRTDRCPLEIGERILNDHETYPTLKLAMRAIAQATDANGKRFKRPWNESFVYQMVRKGKLNLKPRCPGPRVKR